MHHKHFYLTFAKEVFPPQPVAAAVRLEAEHTVDEAHAATGQAQSEAEAQAPAEAEAAPAVEAEAEAEAPVAAPEGGLGWAGLGGGWAPPWAGMQACEWCPGWQAGRSCRQCSPLLNSCTKAYLALPCSS